MKRRTRTILFIVFLSLFFLMAPSIILYSQGYRFDFEANRVVPTGAFYFKISPKNSQIYIDGKPKKKTSSISGSVFMKNLLPKTYHIEIKKEGYRSWQKSLPIKEKQVTEAKNIVLFAENPNFTMMSQEPKEIQKIVSGISPYATSSDEKKYVEVIDYEIWISFLKDQPQQPQKKSGDRIFLTRLSEKIGKIFWLNDEHLIFNTGDKIKIAEIDDRDRINIFGLAEFQSPEIFWLASEKKLYILSGGKLYLSENLLP